MMPRLVVFQQTRWLPFLLLLNMGCAQSVMQEPTRQEYLGIGIVSGTLGEQKRTAQFSGDPTSLSVVGQVQVLEGGAYLIRDAQGNEIRVPHDENTRIDRPAHVGDHIQSWLDRHGRAVRIRNLDGNTR